MKIILLILSLSIFAQEPKVVVVGAGIAGLTAAHRLCQQGIDVHVYEARNRVGGRILSAIVDGRVIELGGQNITDGGEAENMRCLIEEFGLEISSTEFKINTCYPQLQNWDPEELHDQLELLAQSCDNMEEMIDALFPKEDPLNNTFSIRLAAYEGGNPRQLSTLYRETFYHMLLGGISTAHNEPIIHYQSIQGGNSLLPEKIAQNLGDRVHLNHQLSSLSKKGDRYLLQFQNGETVEADRIILAIPCSVYKQIAFEGFPPEKLQAIQSIPYGTNAKLIVPLTQFPKERKTLFNYRAIGFLNPGHTSLVLYYTGEASRFSSDSIHDTYAIEIPIVEEGFGPVSHSVVHAIDQNFVSYETPVGYSWPNDPLVRGSYSYIAPGQEVAMTETEELSGEIVKKLFAPIGHLYFAGEHASILQDVPGTMEAAAESGERAARFVCNSLKTPFKKCTWSRSAKR